MDEPGSNALAAKIRINRQRIDTRETCATVAENQYIAGQSFPLSGQQQNVLRVAEPAAKAAAAYLIADKRFFFQSNQSVKIGQSRRCHFETRWHMRNIERIERTRLRSEERRVGKECKSRWTA